MGCSGDVWVQRGCGVMYEAMVMWEWSGDVGAVVMWDDGWGDSGCSVDVGGCVSAVVTWGDVWVQ